MTAQSTGWFPFRVWELTAFDGGKVVVKIDQDYASNKAKFDDFMKKLDELGCAQVRPDPVHHRVSFWDWGWTPPPFVKNGDVAALVPYGNYFNASGDMAKSSPSSTRTKSSRSTTFVTHAPEG